jgi:Pectate lyase superfamily protein/Major tropism determinant N-terminal domain
MAILQISQIQVRRGLQEDLPQLASGEFGWSVDTQRLFIGNGTIQEGAPAVGVTEILTQYSNFTSFLGSYTYKGLVTGFQTITGPNVLSPILRTLQDKLDDVVDVRDFGAVGNGIADDTLAINRAIQAIYLTSYNGSSSITQRAINFPAGNYKVSGVILLPPNCTLKGEGKNNSILTISSTASYAGVTTCDNLFQYSNYIGLNHGKTPSAITITDLGFVSTASVPLALVNTASDVIFDRCQFNGGNYGVYVTGPSSAIKINNCTFVNYTTAPVYIDSTVTGVVVRNDHLDSTQMVMGVGTTTLTSLTGAGFLDYQLTDSSSNIRFGKFNYSVSNGTCVFEEEYTEPAVGLGANLFANSTGTLTCTVTNTTTIKYQNKTFT